MRVFTTGLYLTGVLSRSWFNSLIRKKASPASTGRIYRPCSRSRSGRGLFKTACPRQVRIRGLSYWEQTARSTYHEGISIKLCLIADARSIHTRRYAEYFAARGYKVDLITYDPSGAVMPGVAEHVVPSGFSNLYLSFLPRHLAIKKIVRSVSPDLIHAHFIAKYGFHLPDLKFHPAVVSAWGDDILILPEKSRLIRYYTGKVLDSADLIYAISGNIRDRIISDFDVPGDRVRYLPFGIDTGIFSPQPGTRGGDGESVTVFSNRGYFPVYDSATLVRGFAIARKRDPRLRLALKGEGPEEEQVRTLVQTEGLAGSVTFLERTSYQEVPEDYRTADIFITTSVSDGTPVSVLEAMATGLPVIATSVGGIPEWITDNETGILVAPRSPEQCAAAILSLAADPSLRHRLGERARETVVARGQWGKLMAQVEKDYEELVNTYRKKRS